MRNAILSWYAYAESGAAADDAPPNGAAPAKPAPPRRGGENDGDERNGLSNPARVAKLFNDARALDAQVSRDGWRHLWSTYGLHGLIDLARRSPWPPGTRDEEVVDAIVRESLAAGYDPVFGRSIERDDRRATSRAAAMSEGDDGIDIDEHVDDGDGGAAKPSLALTEMKP